MPLQKIIKLPALLLLSAALPSIAVDFDYDGDGKADVAVRRASTQYWYVKNSGTDNFNSSKGDGIQRTQFGTQETDIPVPADYDGDGITDFAVRRPSTFYWYVRNSSGSNYNSSREDGIQRVQFGLQASDIPVPADYDGDGIDDFAVRRTSNYYWYILNSSGGNYNSDKADGIQRVKFGTQEEDIPVKGDFNGDGIDDIAVRRPSTFYWYILNSSGDKEDYNAPNGDQIQRIQFGLQATDIPVPADYDGDGITDVAVRRPSNFTWYILQSSDGEIQRIVFGKDENDIPVPADYDGDGKADVAVRRASNQYFYIQNSSDGEIQRISFGAQEDDIPVNAPIDEIISKLDSVNNPTPVITNTPPVANAGEAQTVTVSETVQLDGSGSSDQDGDTLTYLWAFSSTPDGSSVTITNNSSETASFTPDVAGLYEISLSVNDGEDSDTDTVSITVEEAVSSTTPDFYTPEPIVDILAETRSVVWQQLLSTPTNLTRFTFGASDSSDIFMVNDDDNNVASALSISTDMASESTIADELLLRAMFKFIQEDEGDDFRIVSTKHSNYALDGASDSDSIILQDYRSGSKDENNAGYLTFTVSSASPITLTANGRKKYDATTESYIDDSSYDGQNVVFQNNTLSLSTAEGTPLNFYEAPIDFSIPFDFNPDQIERVSNDEVTPQVKGSDHSDLPDSVVTAYSDQVTAMGANDATNAAAEAMLDSIETALAAEGAQLRYPKSFYLTVRDGFFSRVYESSDSTDGILGQLTVPYVFFTNETDDDGNHHPFMVIASYGLPDTLTLLWDVAKPPGDGGTNDYTTQSVTRSIHYEKFLTKIPLRDYGEVESLTENDMNNDLASDVGETNLTHHNYASISATGMAIDGVLVYPSYNNALHVAQADAELSAHGMHSGRGLGAHYHADAHSARNEGLNLYNDSDYIGRRHPPIVTLGFDGVAGYGIYRAQDSAMDGADVALDDFGGHEHGEYGYHYHSYPVDAVTEEGRGPSDPEGGVSYTAHQLPPLGAWSGRINDIPEFWSGTAPNYVGGRSKYLGTEESN